MLDTEAKERAQAIARLRSRLEQNRNAPQQADLSIDERRLRLRDLSRLNPPAEDIEVARIALGDITGTVVRALGASAKSALLHFHGGSYVAGASETYAGLLGELSRYSGRTAISIDYRLAPEHPFPAALNDAVSAYTNVTRMFDDVAVVGDSAGGGLAIAALFEVRRLQLRMASRLALFSPWADLTGQANSIRTKAASDPLVYPLRTFRLGALYCTGHDPRNPLISPVFGDYSGFPPTLIQAGSDEVLLDDSLAVDLAARKANVSVTLEVWPEMIHVWHIFLVSLPQAREAVYRAGTWLSSQNGV